MDTEHIIDVVKNMYRKTGLFLQTVLHVLALIGKKAGSFIVKDVFPACRHFGEATVLLFNNIVVPFCRAFLHGIGICIQKIILFCVKLFIGVEILLLCIASFLAEILKNAGTAVIGMSLLIWSGLKISGVLLLKGSRWLLHKTEILAIHLYDNLVTFVHLIKVICVRFYNFINRINEEHRALRKEEAEKLSHMESLQREEERRKEVQRIALEEARKLADQLQLQEELKQKLIDEQNAQKKQEELLAEIDEGLVEFNLRKLPHAVRMKETIAPVVVLDVPHVPEIAQEETISEIEEQDIQTDVSNIEAIAESNKSVIHQPTTDLYAVSEENQSAEQNTALSEPELLSIDINIETGTENDVISDNLKSELRAEIINRDNDGRNEQIPEQPIVEPAETQDPICSVDNSAAMALNDQKAVLKVSVQPEASDIDKQVNSIEKVSEETSEILKTETLSSDKCIISEESIEEISVPEKGGSPVLQLNSWNQNEIKENSDNLNAESEEELDIPDFTAKIKTINEKTYESLQDVSHAKILEADSPDEEDDFLNIPDFTQKMTVIHVEKERIGVKTERTDDESDLMIPAFKGIKKTKEHVLDSAVQIEKPEAVSDSEPTDTGSVQPVISEQQNTEKNHIDHMFEYDSGTYRPLIHSVKQRLKHPFICMSEQLNYLDYDDINPGLKNLFCKYGLIYFILISGFYSSVNRNPFGFARMTFTDGSYIWLRLVIAAAAGELLFLAIFRNLLCTQQIFVNYRHQIRIEAELGMVLLMVYGAASLPAFISIRLITFTFPAAILIDAVLHYVSYTKVFHKSEIISVLLSVVRLLLMILFTYAMIRFLGNDIIRILTSIK